MEHAAGQDRAGTGGGDLLWELRVVQGGLKDASRKDCGRDEGTTSGRWKRPDTTHINMTQSGFLV